MNGRMRSPSYPSTPLAQAIDYISKIHQIERSNPIDREVAAKALGYSGISGRSATILANLIQYGLLQKAGKNEVRVTERAVEILYPDSAESKANALREAAQYPELFQRVMERFTDGIPSDNALKAFFIKERFTDAAIPAAIRAFRETFEFLRNAIESESYWDREGEVVESQTNQQVENPTPMLKFQQTPVSSVNAGRLAEIKSQRGHSDGAEILFLQRRIQLGGAISNRKQAEELIATLNALKPMLKDGDEAEMDPTADRTSKGDDK